MKILVVDNNTVHKNALATALSGYQVEFQKYQPGIVFNDWDKDLVILTGGGGEGQEISDLHKANHLWYEDEMNYVLGTDKPVVGICMGFEVISSAFGAAVEEMNSVVKGVKNISVTKDGQAILKADSLKQLKAHKWHVNEAPSGFKSLAMSDTGVEVMMHDNRPIIATQFHPEAPTGTFSLEMFKQLVLNR